MKNGIFVISLSVILFLQTINNAQEVNMLEKIIKANLEKLNPVISDIDKYELQILYTRVNRNGNEQPSFKTHAYNEQKEKYFYPASTVKFPVALAALEKLNEINIEGVNKYSHFSIDSLYEGLVSYEKDYKDKCGYPNLANYIQQIFLVSDNDSFNRLYDFLGQKEINKRLQRRGFNKTRIVHRLSVSRSPEQNKQTNPMKFYNDKNDVIYKQEGVYDSANVNLPLTDTKKGKGYFSNGELINEPKDFSSMNYFSLRDQHNLIIRIMYPELFSKEEQFNLTDSDYKFLRKYMSMLPKDSECPKYDYKDHWDSLVKFLMFGDTKDPMPDHIKIYNKVGLAYGYLTDNAYIVDEKNNKEFFLSVTLNVNANQIYNDDKYEYDEIGLPFLAKLGKLIHQFELDN